MKLTAFVAVLSSFIACSALAMFEGPAPTVPAKLPSYLEAPEQEVLKLISEIEKQGWVGPAEISIDSLRHPGDKFAYDKAIEILARRMQWAMYELSELKRNVIRYSVIVNQANLSKEKVMLITETSSKINQNHYFRSIWSLAGAANEEQDALGACISEVCVIEVADAFEELTRFVQQINRDLDFRKLNADKSLFWKFDRPILRASFSKTFRAMIPNNKDHNAYKVLAAGIVTPLSMAGVTTVDLLKAAGSAVFNPRYSNIQLTVEEIGLDYGKAEKFHKNLFQSNYQDTANGSRARAWSVKKAQEDAAKKSVPETGSVPTPADPMATQDVNYWFALAKGKSETEKMACAKMGVISADKYDRLFAEARAKINPIGSQLVEIREFAKGLTSKHYTDIKAYAESYKAFIDGKRTASDLAALDGKMKGYLFETMTANFDASRKRFAKGTCPTAGYTYQEPALSNESPAGWSKNGEGDCMRYGYYGSSYQYANATATFLSVNAGDVKFWACARLNHGGSSFATCSAVSLVTRAEEGTSFASATRIEELKGRQGKPWMSQTKEEFVAAEIPACF